MSKYTLIMVLSIIIILGGQGLVYNLDNIIIKSFALFISAGLLGYLIGELAVLKEEKETWKNS